MSDQVLLLPFFIEIPVINANSVDPDQTPHSTLFVSVQRRRLKLARFYHTLSYIIVKHKFTKIETWVYPEGPATCTCVLFFLVVICVHGPSLR